MCECADKHSARHRSALLEFGAAIFVNRNPWKHIEDLSEGILGGDERGQHAKLSVDMAMSNTTHVHCGPTTTYVCSTLTQEFYIF